MGISVTVIIYRRKRTLLGISHAHHLGPVFPVINTGFLTQKCQMDISALSGQNEVTGGFKGARPMPPPPHPHPLKSQKQSF